MKKVLLTTTALTLLAGAAAAEMGVSGDGRVGVNSTGGTTTVDYRYRVYFKGSGETDGGLTFGAKTGIRLDDPAVLTGIFGASLWVSNGTMTLRVGNTGGAVTSTSGIWSVPTVGYSGMSFGGQLWTGISSSTTTGAGPNNVALDFTLGSANVTLSQTIAGNAEFAANFKLGSATVGIGYDNGTTATTGGTVVTAAFDAGSATIAAAYRMPAAGGAAEWALGASTAMGAGSLKGYASNRGATNNYGIGYGASLGGGASWAVGFQSIGGTTRVEAGLNFGF